MAQLNDTMVQGDLRVTGKIYGTDNAIRLENANLAIPPLGNGEYVGSAGDFFIGSGSGKNLPDTSNNFNIHTTVTHFSGTIYRLTQIATPTSSSNPVGIYERSGSSSDGVTWTFGSWLAAANSSHTHGNVSNGGTLTDTAAAAAGNDYVVIRDADNAKIQTSTIKGTDVADAVSKKHSHSTLTLSTTAQAYDGSHTLALPSTDPYTSARTPASHTHGNVTNGGALQTNDITIASGDKLVVTDSSDSNKIARTSVSFDGSTTTTALTPKGTFEAFAKSGDITTAIQALDVSSVGGGGKYISAISEADGKISATATSMDTAPTASSTNAVTSGGVKTALDGKQADLKYQLVEYGATYNDVSAIISNGKTPVVRLGDSQNGYKMYTWDGLTRATSEGYTEYYFVLPVADATLIKLSYVCLNQLDSTWSSGEYSWQGGTTSQDALFHAETLNVTDGVTRFLKISFSGRVGRCIAVISIAGGSSTTNAVFRLSWTFITSGITDIGKEMISCSSFAKPPLVYRDSSSFYIGIYDSLNRSATVSVMMSSEDASKVSYSTVTRSVATASGNTEVPITWHPVMSETIDEIYAAVYDDTSGTTVATTFNELKSWYSTRPNIMLVVRHVASGTTTQDIYRLVDTEYANGSATKFVFARTMNDAGFVGQVETMTCTSSGWAYSRPLSSTAIADNNDNLITTAGVKAAFDYWMPLKQNALNFTDTPSSINPVATKTYVDTYYNNNAAFGRWAYCYYGNAMYLFDGLRHHIMTFDDGNIASWVKRATQNFAQSVEIIFPTDSSVTMLNLHQTYSSDGAYHAFAPGGRYVFTVQNMSNNTIAVKLFVGGCFPTQHLYDCWSVVHDGVDDTYIGWLDYDNPIGWHEHLLANVGSRSSKSWEIIVPPEYVVPSGQGYNYKSIQYVIISTIK